MWEQVVAAQRAAVAGLQGMAAWRVAARVVEWVAVYEVRLMTASRAHSH